MEQGFIDIIMQIISTVGFPIAMCILIFFRMKQETENHIAEIRMFRETLNENTTILAQLKQLIDDKL